ncbi:hypothetical protein LVY72_12390 [Arthrobacter sp. I2-34]|uniref:Uncharacterized protein n=1 Tax=Arthrobacter hankyongi TaxID=2904801 RepID=A0ABS9L882_9MICC|nr:hypothetical protein [Arthrobacter hankyongi]MCG2622702.1 hypothetical protein [Arthrobacter hankyongi]
MSQTTALAVLAGTALGVGLWLTFTGLPVMRRRSFADRIYPQLKTIELQSRVSGNFKLTAGGRLD